MKIEFEWLLKKQMGILAIGFGYVFADGRRSFGFLLGICSFEIVFKDNDSTHFRLPEDNGKIKEGSSATVDL